MAFPELLRSNRLGMSDPLDRALSLAEHRVMTGGGSRGFGGIRPMQRQQQQQGMQGPGGYDWIKQTQINNRGLPPGVENVVYDQRPELAAKQLDLEKRQFERQGELMKSDQERQAKKDIQDTDAYERNRRMNTMTDKEKIDADYANRELIEQGRYNRAMEQYAAAQKRVETQQQGATGRTGMTVAGADLRSQRNAELRRDLQAATSDAEMAQIMQRYQNEYALKDEFKPRVPISERVHTMIGKAINDNPDFWKVVQEDKNGNYQILPPPEGEDPLATLRSQLTRRVFGLQDAQPAPNGQSPQFAPNFTPAPGTVPQSQGTYVPGTPSGLNRKGAMGSGAVGGLPPQDPNRPLDPRVGTGLMRPGQVVDPNAPKDYSGKRSQPTNQADLARLSAGIKQDFQNKKGRPPSEQELEAIIAHYLGGQ